MKAKRVSRAEFTKHQHERGRVMLPVVLSGLAGIVLGVILVAGPFSKAKDANDFSDNEANLRFGKGQSDWKQQLANNDSKAENPATAKDTKPSKPLYQTATIDPVAENKAEPENKSPESKAKAMRPVLAQRAKNAESELEAFLEEEGELDSEDATDEPEDSPSTDEQPAVDGTTSETPTAKPSKKTGVKKPGAKKSAVDLLEEIRDCRNRKRFLKLAGEYMAMGPEQKASVLTEVKARLTTARAELSKKGGPSLKTLQRYRKRLDDARKVAVGLIRDASTYRKSGKQVFGQDEVDDAVHAVRKIYQGKKVVSAKGSLRSAKSWILAMNKFLGEHSPSDRQELSADEWQLMILSKKAIRFQEYCWTKQELYIQVRDGQVAQWNKKAAPAGEKGRFFRMLNDYRNMLGIHRLAYDSRIQKAAQGHTSDMANGPFFSHDSPIASKRTPAMRIGLAGTFDKPSEKQSFYESSPFPIPFLNCPRLQATGRCGENIAFGVQNANGAYNLWYHSPPHHRNMIGNWDILGVGNQNEYWTLNFHALNVSTSKR